MTIETMTIDTLVFRVYFAISNVSTSTIANVDPNLKSEIKWALHCALRELVERTEHHGFRARGSISVTAGTAQWALPDDFHRIIEEGVKFAASDYRTLEYISEQEWDARMLDSDTSQAEPVLYTLTGRKTSNGTAQIKFYPTPSTSRTITVNYLTIPLKVYDLNDGNSLDTRIPPEYHHILVAGALKHLPAYAKDLWPIWKGQWDEYVQEARKKSVPVTGQSYQRELYTSGVSAIGLGRVPATLTGPSL